MSAPEAPPPGSSDATPSRVPSPELEIKDAPLIFGQVWNRLVQERGVENMVFPKEIMWLGGAPGSGKGTNTPLILRERGLTAPPIVVSDLLDTPEMRALKDRGQFVGDREVIEALLRKLLEPEYQTGVVRPRSRRMNGVLVPLPEPGAPPSHMISFGKTMFSTPRSCTSRFHTWPKINGASLISSSGEGTRLGGASLDPGGGA